MSITFVPDAGDVLMCDFQGFQPPEMTKVRPVIVLSRRSRTSFPETYIIVPTSRTAPAPPEAWHCEFKRGSYQFFDPAMPIWAKCDMVTSVAAHRLDRMKINGRWSRAQIRKDDLSRVRRAVLHAMGMESWKELEVIVQTTVIATESDPKC